jgi:hypothetical protein
MNKICRVCKVEKHFSLFKKTKENKSGFLNICKDCSRDYKRKWREKNKEHIRTYRVFYEYGLTKDEYERLNKSCVGCGSEVNLVVDHNHTTGAVRGLLCSPCNLALGLVKDNTTILSNLIKYLQSSP